MIVLKTVSINPHTSLIEAEERMRAFAKALEKYPMRNPENI